MADDSESDRPSPDADESEERPSDDAATTESSDAPTEEASVPSDDTDSDESVSGDATDAPPDAGESEERPSDDAESAGEGDAEDTDDGGGDESDAATSDVATSAEETAAAAEESDDDAADADAEETPDEDTDAEETPDEETDADGTSDEAAAGPTTTDESDLDADNLWPEAHDRPEPKTPEELGLEDDESDSEADDESGPDDELTPADENPGAVADTDGGAPANPTVSGTDPDPPADVVDDGVFGDGPESDEEMPLADHIEEMVNRLAVVFLVGGLVTLVLYPGADLANSALNLNLVSATDVINFLWNKHIPGAPEIADRRPRVYGPLELVLTELKVAALAGLVVGLPVFVYETYLFMRPGLFPRERRYYLAAVPTSLVLAFVGIAFAHFIVLPAIFAYFTSYTQGTAVIAFGLKETFNLILILMGYNAIIFQIPLFIMLAIMMNLVTREWLVARRLIFWASFLGLAFFVSPDPTGMAPIIIAATMITLFEGTLFLLRWTGN